ncbi:hypothetical protein CW665_02470 [Macrococcoides caseolyticum]|nr:hypothetical protein CW665_02470 [Macrococcus caseolyticus]
MRKNLLLIILAFIFTYSLVKMLDFLTLAVKQGYFDLSLAFIFSSLACLIAQITCIRHIKFKE